MSKPKLILAGRVPENSFLHLELGLGDVFSLRIGTLTYKQRLEQTFKNFDLVFDSVHSREELSRMGKVYDAFEYRTDLNSPDYVDLKDRQNVFSLLLTNTPARNFNSFQKKGDYLEKQCRRSLKAQQEYFFLSHVPEEIQEFFPKVRNFSDHGNFQKYEIELIPYFDFGKIFLHTAIPQETFINLIRRLDNFRKQSPKLRTSKDEYQNKLRNLFVEKLQSRVRELETLPNGSEFIKQFNMYEVSEKLSRLLETKIETVDGTEMLFSHGDMCFSNILFDQKTKSIKFVDPRGINTLEEAYLPWYYDLAKLSHSMFGLYDMTINGVPDQKTAQQEKFIQGFQKIFLEWIESNHWDYELLKLCEASLFVSMIPFHIQNKEHARIHFQAGVRAMQAVL